MGSFQKLQEFHQAPGFRSSEESQAQAQGRVFWFTGLSGVGKTTLSRLFAQRMRNEGRSVVLLDGDELREMWADGTGHTAAERKKVAFRNARLCRLLADQGIDVVCATISLFHDCQAWNRSNIPGYVELYISAPLSELRRRDSKGLYLASPNGGVSDVVGIDLQAEIPVAPDFRIDNNGRRKPSAVIDELWDQLKDSSF